MGLLGAHVSVAGGLHHAFERGDALQCNAIQIFSKNQRQWRSPPLTEKSILEFHDQWKQSSIQQIVIHDSYLINLANPDQDRLQQSREAFLDEMIRADQLNVPYLVFHPGSHMKTDEQAGLNRISDSLNWALDQNPNGKVKLLLETTAGQGDHLGSCFEHFSEILRRSHIPERIGVCFDTAHAFAAGYDICTSETYKAVFSQFNQLIGLEKLKVFHLNDSKAGLGSRVDRHDHIGKGQMGIKPFEFLVNDSRFANLPMLLETPGGESNDREHLDLLRSLVKS